MVNTVSQYSAAEMRWFVLPDMEVNVPSNEALRSIFSHYPIPAFPFVSVSIDAVDVSKAFD